MGAGRRSAPARAGLDRTDASTLDPPRPRRRSAPRAVTAVGAIGVAALTIAACGSSSPKTTATGGTHTTASGASTGTSGGTPAQGANVTAAQKAIAPFSGRPSPFPATTPLPMSIPAGTKMVYLQCGAPTCALVGKMLAGAVKTLGGKLTTINAGTTASSSQQAASSAVALKPKVVFIIGIQPSFFGSGLKQLQSAGAKVVSYAVSLPQPQKYGITYNYIGVQPLQRAGQVMADWVIAHKGVKANVVFYGAPEVTQTSVMEASFKQQLATDCSSCSVRFVPVSITTAGTTAPKTIANDLQSHPSTNMAVAGEAELTEGLPTALKAAGVKVTTLMYNPLPQQLSDIKSGGLTAGFAVDVPTQIWTGVDVGARLVLGSKPTAGEDEGFGPFQFLAQKDITFDPQNGWTGYPDFPQRFAKLWQPTK